MFSVHECVGFQSQKWKQYAAPILIIFIMREKCFFPNYINYIFSKNTNNIPLIAKKIQDEIPLECNIGVFVMLSWIGKHKSIIVLNQVILQILVLIQVVSLNY